MITRPVVHGTSVTVGQLRAFFGDDHVHMALLVEGGRLVGTVERADLTAAVGVDMPAASIAALAGRTVGPDEELSRAFDAMTRSGRRRLAVTNERSDLLGLLCLKQSGRGFCTDSDVSSRRCAAPRRP
jgi:CBS domain-containing protein